MGARGRARCCKIGLDLSRLVQTCLKISIQMTRVFSHFHKNSEHMLFSTRTLTILLKKVVAKLQKKLPNKTNLTTHPSNSIPPSSQTTLMLLYTYFFQNLNFLFAFLL